MALANAPLPRGHETGARPRQVDRQFGAHAKAMRHGRDAVDTGATRHLVEVHVATVLDATAQIESAVTALPPAMEPRIAEIEIAGAVDQIAGRDRAGLQPRHRDGHLE